MSLGPGGMTVSMLLVMMTDTPKSVSFAVPSGAISTLFLEPWQQPFHAAALSCSICCLTITDAMPAAVDRTVLRSHKQAPSHRCPPLDITVDDCRRGGVQVREAHAHIQSYF